MFYLNIDITHGDLFLILIILGLNAIRKKLIK